METKSHRIRKRRAFGRTINVSSSMFEQLRALSKNLNEPSSVIIRFALAKLLETQRVEFPIQIPVEEPKPTTHEINVKVSPAMNTEIIHLSAETGFSLSAIVRFSLKQILNTENLTIPNNQVRL